MRLLLNWYNDKRVLLCSCLRAPRTKTCTRQNKYQFMTPYATNNLVTLLPLCLEDFWSITLHCWIWLHLFGLRENNYLWGEKNCVRPYWSFKGANEKWSLNFGQDHETHLILNILPFFMCSLTCQCLLRNLFYIIRPHLFLARPCIHDSPFSKFALPCICPLHIIILCSC